MANQIAVSGNLGRDAEAKSKGDYHWLKFSLAETQYNKQTKEQFSVWWNVTLFGSEKRVNSLSSILLKGRLATVLGTINVQTYETKDGETKSDYAINANDVIINWGSDDGGGGGGGDKSSYKPKQTTKHRNAAPPDDDDDGDVPF